MSERIDDILNEIDAGLDDRVIHVTRDLYMSLETSVWADLHESVEQGWRTQEEAEEAFLQWREAHRQIGAPAVRSQIQGVSKQQYSDNKRRMKRC